jgi:hypothetical protein
MKRLPSDMAKKSRTVLRQVRLAYESLFGCQPADGAARHT